MMTVCLLVLPMEPRLAPLGRPTLMGPIGNLSSILVIQPGSGWQGLGFKVDMRMQ
jgi:hypothetical protein